MRRSQDFDSRRFVDAQTRGRVVGGSGIVLAAIGFLTVTLGFDPTPAQNAGASVAIAAPERPQPPVSVPDAATAPAPSIEASAPAQPPKARPKAKKMARAMPEDEAMINDAIRSRMTALGRCYDSALLRDPDLSGRLSVRVEVSRDGRVASTQIRRDTIRDPGLAACTRQRIEGWRFPRLQDGSAVQVTIPVTFVR